jgi:hypothetical protein
MDRETLGAYLRPISSTDRDIPVGRDEAGNTIYQTVTGHRYTVGYEVPQRPEGSGLRAVNRVDDAGRYYHDVEEAPRSPGMSRIVAALANGFTAPGRALSGQGVTMADVLDTAGMVSLGTISRPASAGNLASKAGKSYNLPTKSEVGDVLGRSGAGGLDLEGRPLVARHVVGRAEAGAVERSLNPAVLDEISERFAGGPIAAVPKSRLPTGAVGAVTKTGRGSLEDARVLETINPDQFTNAARHEAGHIIDYVSGNIPTTGITKEIQQLYDYGGSPNPNPRRPIAPDAFGYASPQYREEYMAEAIRQYMTAPDTMKAKYPAVAARIREYVNANPKIMDLIQFNSVAAGGLGLAGMASPQFAEDETRKYLGGT